MALIPVSDIYIYNINQISWEVNRVALSQISRAWEKCYVSWPMILKPPSVKSVCVCVCVCVCVANLGLSVIHQNLISFHQRTIWQSERWGKKQQFVYRLLIHHNHGAPNKDTFYVANNISTILDHFTLLTSTVILFPWFTTDSVYYAFYI